MSTLNYFLFSVNILANLLIPSCQNTISPEFRKIQIGNVAIFYCDFRVEGITVQVCKFPMY